MKEQSSKNAEVREKVQQRKRQVRQDVAGEIYQHVYADYIIGLEPSRVRDGKEELSEKDNNEPVSILKDNGTKAEKRTIISG